MVKANTPGPLESTALLDGSLPQQLHRALNWALDTPLLNNLTAHGNTSWTFPEFILLTLFWVWSECTTLTKAFSHASQLCQSLLGTVVFRSYTGFAGALKTWTPTLRPLLWQRLQQRMETVGDRHWRIGRWLPLAVDGSRTTTPRTRQNETAFCPPRFGRGATAKSRKKWKNKTRRSKALSVPVHPQIWLTLLWHMGLKMPWSWQCGPSTASERQHFTEMLQTQEFPEHTLFCGDAGFVGYDLWRAMIDRGHHFLIRVGSNVRLLRGLGTVKQSGDLVHFWPKAAMAKKDAPLALRLLTFRVGKCEVHALTNVLSERQLSSSQAVQLYRARWGVELQFRSLKQTFGRSKLHSRTPELAYAELDWSLLGLWLIQLLTVSEQIPQGIGPERSSVSVAVQVFRDAMNRRRASSLKKELAAAVKDEYQRRAPKGARYRPKTKDKPAAGPPQVMDASVEQRRKYQQVMG
jgi:hypothetical protein